MCIRQKSDFLKKLYACYLGWFLFEFITIFFSYPNPDPRFLKRIRIRPNDTDRIRIIDPDPDPRH